MSSSTDNPLASAAAFNIIGFFLCSAVKRCVCLSTSADAPAIYPVKANALALSKLRARLVSSSNCNSLLKLVSKSNKLEAIPLAVDKLIPNFLVWYTALASAFSEKPK